MSEAGLEIAERWRSYFREHRHADIQNLIDEYPSQRSLYVDILTLYDLDSEFVTVLFDRPNTVLETGRKTLKQVTNVSGPVHLRVTNNPQQQPVTELKSRHAYELVTVEGLVADIAPRQATATSAVYSCPACEDVARFSQAPLRRNEPIRCDGCGWTGEFELVRSKSTFVDLQQVHLQPLEGHSQGRTAEDVGVPAYLTDDIVGSVTEGGRCCITGILRLQSTGSNNQYDLYLDGLAVEEDQMTHTPDEIDDVLDAVWEMERV